MTKINKINKSRFNFPTLSIMKLPSTVVNSLAEHISKKDATYFFFSDEFTLYAQTDKHYI